MKTACFLQCLLAVCLFVHRPLHAQPAQTQAPLYNTILHHDSLFWQAYHACDVDVMTTFFTDDLEFYHDKSGVTTGLPAFTASIKQGLCGNENLRLRREAVEGSLRVYAMDHYGAILTGEHVFYIVEKDRKERLDGLARFTHLWQYKNNTWKMARVLSYDHRQAPYKNTRKEILLSRRLLKQYTGTYQAPQTGTIHITSEDNRLVLQTGRSQTPVYAETETRFFMKERDIQFEFVKDAKNVQKMIVYERGEIAEEAEKTE